MERLQQGGAALRWSNQPRILLEMTLIGFIVAPIPSLEDLARRVETLEKQLLELHGSGLPAERQQTGRLPAKDQLPAAAGSERHNRSRAGQGQPVRGATSASSRPVMAGRQQTEATKLREETGRQAEMPAAGDRAGSKSVRKAGKKSDTQTASGRGKKAVAAAERKTAGHQELELAVVQDRWKEVLTAARQESVHLQAYLREAEPVAVANDSVTVMVTTDFHRGMLEQPANREKVETVLNKVFGLPLRLLITAEKQPPEEANQEVIEQIKEYFGPEKVEIID